MGFNWLDGADGLNDGKVATIRPWLDLIIRYGPENINDSKLITKAKDMRKKMTIQELDRQLKELEKVGIKLSYTQLDLLALALLSDTDRESPVDRIFE